MIPREFQSAAGGQAMGDARDVHAFGPETLGQVVTRRVSFHVGAQGEDDFLDRFGPETLFQLLNSQVLRIHAAEGRDFASEDVEFATVGAGLLDAQDVDGVLDDADQRGIAPRVEANRARHWLGQGATVRAGPDAFARLDDRLGQLAHGSFFALHEVQRQPFRRARADAGQTAQRGEQFVDWFGEGSHHGPPRGSARGNLLNSLSDATERGLPGKRPGSNGWSEARAARAIAFTSFPEGSGLASPCPFLPWRFAAPGPGPGWRR